jgi:hypothetical protein
MRYGLGYEQMTLRAIGEHYSRNGETIRQVENKALRKFRHPSRARRIKPLFASYSELLPEIESRDEQITTLKGDISFLTAENLRLQKQVKELGGEITKNDPVDKMPSLLDLTIKELNLSVRAYNCLLRAGINTVGDIASRHKEGGIDGFLKIRNLGRKCADEVLYKMKEIGIPLKQPNEE